MHFYDSKLAAYYGVNEALVQAGTLAVYNDLKENQGALLITGLVNVGASLFALHLSKLMYGSFHSTAREAGVDYRVSSRDRFQYGAAVRAAKRASISPSYRRTMKKKAVKVLENADHFSINFQRLASLFAATKITYASLQYYNEDPNILKAVAYGMFIPSSVIRARSTKN